MTELAEYHYTLHHIPGKQNRKPDALSRRPDHDKGDHNNEGITLLKPQYLRQLSEEGFLLIELDPFYKQIYKNRTNRDNKVQKALNDKVPGWKELPDGIVTWQERIYIPKNRNLREMIIASCHNLPTAGHPGKEKTTELIL